MRKYKYYDLDGDITLTEQEIIDQYWMYWCERMRSVGRDELITRQNCIDDFCVIHWAFEVKDEV